MDRQLDRDDHSPGYYANRCLICRAVSELDHNPTDELMVSPNCWVVQLLLCRDCSVNEQLSGRNRCQVCQTPFVPDVLSWGRTLRDDFFSIKSLLWAGVAFGPWVMIKGIQDVRAFNSEADHKSDKDKEYIIVDGIKIIMPSDPA